MLNLEQEVGSWDIVLLEPLNEEHFLSNLQKRFRRDHIYTYIGNILISVNPYKKLALYSADLAENYVKRGLFQLPPHIYALAGTAYRWLTDKNEDQCILITGESGAGKTETARIILQFLVLVSGESPNIKTTKDLLVQANTLLEAFGNAKTCKNDNASRFGKFLDIEFDFKGDPIGGHLTHFCLDKGRVTTLHKNDRNFHIFYQLLSGADISLLKCLKLQRNVEHYKLLQTSHDQPTLPVEDDKNLFVYTQSALEIYFPKSYFEIFEVIAIILKLGNLKFVPCNNIDGTEGSSISNEFELFEICQLLRTDAKFLQRILTSRQIDDLGITVELNQCEAAKIRNLICKTMYSRLFTFLINKINELLKGSQYGKRRVLGVLDLYGFESFEINSFEQLVINYCNEKLHQFVINANLKLEQEEIIKEGLEWSRVDFFNNTAICQLLELENYGILNLLNDSVVQNDTNFLTRIEQCCLGHSHCDVINDSNVFQIRHYAGAVQYRVKNFVEKNRNFLPKSISRTLYYCENPLTKQLFPEGNPKRCQIKKPIPKTVQLQIALNSLLKSLGNRQIHYVRCLKPNELKQPKIFEIPLVLHQVRYLNLVPTVQIRRAGFSHNLSYHQFLSRYRIICCHTFPRWRGSAIEGTSLILRALPIPQAEFTFGRSRLFIRSPRTVFELEDFRKAKLHDLALLIQTSWRGFRERRKFMRLKQAEIVICLAWRQWKERQKALTMARREKIIWASKIIQRHYVQWMRKRFFDNLIAFNKNPESESPLSKAWPTCPSLFLRSCDSLLRKLHHRWRCAKFRAKFDQTARNRMREKVTASFLFKNKKISYVKSVSQPFMGDYVRLRQNLQWKRISTENNDQYVVFADIVNKIARSSGKYVPILLVVSTKSMLILDHKTLQIKYRVPASEIYRVSLSPYPDELAVVHVRAYDDHLVSPEMQQANSDPTGCLFQSDLNKKKGDFVFQTRHVIEVVTKLFLVVQNATGKPPDVNVSNEFEANFASQVVTFVFKYTGYAEHVRVLRKGNKMEVIV